MLHTNPIGHGRPARARSALLALAGCAALLAGATDARADTTITSVPAWDGTQAVSPFGGTPTYGQTVTVPAGENRLTSFSFIMRGNTSRVFRGQVYAWNGDRAQGAPLWSSAPRTVSAEDSWETVTFSAGGVPVTPGQKIVLLATTLFDTSSGSLRWAGSTGVDAVPGGEFNYQNDSDPATAITGKHWDGAAAFGGGDVAFTAQFGSAGTAAPAPIITGVSATSGSVGGGETIVISGENFSDGTGVLFGDTPSSAVTLESSRRLSVVTPAHAAGTVPLVVVSANGRSDAAAFTYVAPEPQTEAQAPSTDVPADQCAVPALKGLALPKARRGLAAAHCRLGAVTVTGKRGRKVVVAQSEPAGTILAAGATVDVTVKRTKR
ncbi:MAG TPA: IPT/TIG domain-containing protein [Capillimicrobium sp.]|nr:IPT/TIG domain-containing protein [Capillimicrobium sp.]